MEELDCLLADDSIEPSSGFASAVMEAVRQDRPPFPSPGAGSPPAWPQRVSLAVTGAVLLSRADLPWADLPLPSPAFLRSLLALGVAALATLLGRGLSRLP